MLMELARFLPKGKDRGTVSPERAAQAVKELRRISEQGQRVPYTVEQELVVPQALAAEGKAKILVFTYRQNTGEGWGSVAVPLNPTKKSTDPAVILGSISIDAISLDDAKGITGEWVGNSTFPLNPGDVTQHKDFSHLRSGYAEDIYTVVSNIA